MKILHISLGKHQVAQSEALKAISSSYAKIDWTEYPHTLGHEIDKVLKVMQPDLTFMQIQTPEIITPWILKKIPGFKINWTGDVRSPIPDWYKEVAPYVSITCFSNLTDVIEFNNLGFHSRFLNIGFENHIFQPKGPKFPSSANTYPHDVVFMGNNYVDRFPLSALRTQMVEALKDKAWILGKRWGPGVNDVNNNPHVEAQIYRGSKIAINLSHFEYIRYTSDRLFRIMACGTFCLSHHYPGIEYDFEVGRHLDTWTTLEELSDKIDYYLKNERLRNIIAKQGCIEVHENHTWKHRVQDILGMKYESSN